MVAVAAVYGPLVWLVMSFGMIPLFTHRHPTMTVRWWIKFIGHFPVVGLPIVVSASREE